MKRQREKKKNNLKKVCRRILKRLIIALLLFILLFSAIGLHDKNNEIDILVKRHTQQQTKIKQLEKENQLLRDTVVYQHGLKVEARKVSFAGATVKPQVHKEVEVNIKPRISEEAQYMSVNEVKEEVHIKNEIKDETIVTTVVATTLVFAKTLARAVFKVPVL